MSPLAEWHPFVPHPSKIPRKCEWWKDMKNDLKIQCTWISWCILIQKHLEGGAMVSGVPVSQEHWHRLHGNLVSSGHMSRIQGRLGFWCPRTQICIFLRKLRELYPQTKHAVLYHQPHLPSWPLLSHLNAPAPHRGHKHTWPFPECAVLPRIQQECPPQPGFLGKPGPNLYHWAQASPSPVAVPVPCTQSPSRSSEPSFVPCHVQHTLPWRAWPGCPVITT